MLDNVSWHFDQTEFNSIENFNNEITDWNNGLAADFENVGQVFEWIPEEVIINRPKFRVEYSYMLNNSYILLPEERLTPYYNRKLKAAKDGKLVIIKLSAELNADNGFNFTALEVMYKLHKLHANKRRTYYLEGFGNIGCDNNGVPIYMLAVGT